MEMFWNEYLFRPLFNLLIFLYQNYTFYSMGLAVVYLTIILRILLLPLSIIAEKSPSFYHMLAQSMRELQNDYPNDYVQQKEALKAILRKNRVHPWAKVLSLAIQFLVLILLYQVFMGGINAREKYDALYPFITRPDFVYTKFLWFDISERNFFMSFLVALILFVEITIVQNNKKELLTSRDLVYRIVFPIFSFVALYLLPSVKSIFILTSILFSFIIIIVQNVIWRLLKIGTNFNK